ncbi:MAG: DNA polymerase III subunit gamma/tau, partial [Planctomycetota bacterium]
FLDFAQPVKRRAEMAKTRTDGKNPKPEPEPAPPTGYTVLARRYRPQAFGALVGQEATAKALANAILSNRVGHAYLFTGPRGVGKTSTARLFARALNCENGPTPEPCGACGPCRDITAGEEVDVIEIDAASHTGVDNIRELRANAGYLPARCRFKIYIIDEVHMLSGSSFNALLKTLEEPPAHVKFIFATTEYHKIPATVLSRCQRFDFRAIGAGTIASLLADIVDKEGREAEPAALALVARQAAGSMRDAQSLLDQALAFTTGTLTAQAVHDLLGSGNDTLVAGLASAALAEKPDEVLRLLDTPEGMAVNPAQLLEQMASWWRDMMVVLAAGDSGPELDVTPRYRDTLVESAKGRDLESVMAGLEVLDHAIGRLRNTAHPRLVVELALVRLSRLGQVVGVAQLAQSLAQQRAAGPAQAPPVPRHLLAPRPPAAPEPPPKKAPAGDRAVPPEPPADATPAATAGPRPAREVWPEVITAVGPMLGGRAAAASLVVRGPGAVALVFPPSARAAFEYLQGSAPRLAKIVETLSQLTGSSHAVHLELEHGPAAATPENPKPEEPRANPMARRLAKERAEEIPLVMRAMELLKATVVHADEDFAKPPEPGTP